LKIFYGINQGPRGDWLTKKTEGRKSRDTAPLRSMIKQISEGIENSVMLVTAANLASKIQYVLKYHIIIIQLHASFPTLIKVNYNF
jgi:hypothetical protein